MGKWLVLWPTSIRNMSGALWSTFQSKKLYLLVSPLLFGMNLELFFFINRLYVGSFLKYKDQVASLLLNNVVHQYKCWQCDYTYIGETIRHFATRIAQHRRVDSGLANSNWYSEKSTLNLKFCVTQSLT